MMLDVMMLAEARDKPWYCWLQYSRWPMEFHSCNNFMQHSQYGPLLVCFVHFGFQMCFAPQSHTRFRHHNFKRGPQLMCFVHFDPFDFQRHAFPPWEAQFVKCASCHSTVHFSTSDLPKALRLWQFSTLFTAFYFQMCFAPQQGASFHFSSGLICPDGSAPTAFVSLLFDPPEPHHWNNLPGCTFPSVQIVGSSTSKVFFGQPKSQQQLI